MTQRGAYLIAASLTAFLLVIGGAVAGRISQANEAAAAQATGAETTLETGSLPEEQSIMEREAAYQDLIQEANQRLNKMYAQAYGVVPDASVKQLNEHYQLIYAQDPANAAPYAFSLQQAASIALQAAPGAVLLRPPELVDFQGVVAYEVVLDKGMIYIDASTGEILYNGLLAPPTTTQANTGDQSNDSYTAIADRGNSSNGGQENRGGSDHEDSHEHEDEPEHEGGDD